MSIFTKTKTPYEFLVRWSADGTLSGAHVGFRMITKEDGVVIADVLEPVVPVAVGLQAGFPLADILANVQAGMKDSGAAFLADIADAEAKKQASEKAEADAVAAKTAAEAAIAAIPVVPEVKPEPEPQDPTVNDLQIRLALTEAGLRDAVEAAVKAGDQNTRDWYERAIHFKRHDPMVLALADALKVTDTQLDELWALAAAK